MAWIEIKSSLTGQTSVVTESAYKNFFKSTGLFTIIGETAPIQEEIKPVINEKPHEEIKPVVDEKPEAKEPKPIKPIKPVKPKADDSKINDKV